MDANQVKQLIKELKAAGTLTEEQAKLLRSLEREQRKVQKSTRDTQASMEDFNRGLDEVGEAFGLRLSQAFDTIEVEVEQAKRDIATMFDDLEATAPEIAASIGEEFNSAFRNALPDPKDIQAQINLNSLISDFKASFPEMGNEMQKAFKTGDIATFYKKFGDEGMKRLRDFLGDKKGFQGMKDYFKPGGDGDKGTNRFRQQLESFEPAAQKTTKVIMNWNNLFRQIGDNILNYIGFGKIIQNLMDFDKKLSNIKREFQIPTAGFSKASSSMSELVKYGAQFGLDNEKAFTLVKNIGEYAKSTNVQNLAATAKQVAAVSDATGIALENVGQLTGQMMFYGANAEKARKAFVDISKASTRFGVNVTAVAKKFQDVFPRFARMGFKAGEESLARMAAKAEKMGTDINKLLDASDKFLDINAALEASADLSLLGGAAAQVSFMDLMKAAQDGPEAMDKLMTQMTSDIGKLNKDGKLQLSMIDRQKIQKIAEASGEDVESVTNRINSRLSDAAKKAAIPPGVFNALSDDEKDFLLSKAVKQGGKWKFEGLEGMQDLKNVSKGSIQAMMNKSKSDAENMEKAAKSRQALEEKLNNLANEVLATFTMFQPYLEMLKHALDKLRAIFVRVGNVIDKVFGAETGKWVKAMALLGGILMLTFGPSAMAKFAGILFRGITSPLKMLSGLGSQIKSAFAGVGGGASKKATETLASKVTTQTPDIGGKMKGMKTPPTMLQQFSKINPAQILSLAAAFVALGIAMLLIGKGIQFAATGFATLVNSFNNAKNAGAALGAIAIVMGGFVAMVYILATASSIAAIPLLALGAAMLMLGASVYLAAKGFSILVPAIISMGKNIGATFKGAAGLIALAAALVIISPALLIFGAAGLIAAPAMIAFGYFLRGLGAAKGVNPKIISQIGDSMGSIAWGLTKLGLVAGPAALAMVSAGALMVVAVALKNISAVDVKKVSQFGQSLALISMSMIKGLVKLALVSPFAVLAMASAVSINIISQALSRIKIIDLAKMQNFGDSMGKVGSAMIKGLIKLGLVSPFTVLAIVSAGAINLISRMLADVKIVDLKKMQAFGQSLAAVSASFIFGLIKLGLVSPFVVLGVVSAAGINLISRLLNNVPVLNPKNLGMTASTMASTSGKFAKAMLKLGLVSVLTPLALLATLGILGVTKMLKAVPTLNAKTLTTTAGTVSKVVWPFTKAFLKLQPLAAFTPLALVAAAGILGVTKMLKAVPMLNPAFLIVTSSVLSKIAWPFTKSLIKLGALSVFTPFAILAAFGILTVTKTLAKVTPLNAAILITTASILNTVSGKFGKSLFKLGLLGVFAIPAIYAARSLVSITSSLSKITPLNMAILINTANALSLSSSAFSKGLKKLGFIGFLAIPAMIAAKSISIITKFLANVTPLDPVKLVMTGVAISLSAQAFSKGMKKLGFIGFFAVPALIAAKSILLITNILSRVPVLNPGILITNAITLSIISTPLSMGLKKIALLSPVAALSSISSIFILKTVRLLNQIPLLSPVKLLTTALTLSAMSTPLAKGLFKISLLTSVAMLASMSSLFILKATKYLAGIPMLNPIKLITTAVTLATMSGPLSNGLKKIGLTAPFAKLASNAALNIFKTATFLRGVPFLSPTRFLTLAYILSNTSEPIAKGLSKLSNAASVANKAAQAASGLRRVTFILLMTLPINAGKLLNIASVMTSTMGPISKGLLKLSAAGFLANRAVKAANSLLKITKTLSNLPVVSQSALKQLATTLSSTAWKLTKGLGKFAGITTVIGPAVVVAKGINSISRNLSSMPAINASSLINLASTLSKTSGKLFWGLTKFAASSVPILPAIAVAEGVKFITKQLSQVVPIDTKKLSNIAFSLAFISPVLTAGFKTFAKMGSSVIGAIFAAKGIVSVTNSLKNALHINSKKLINIGDTLYYASPNLSRGFITFSRAGYYAGLAIVAAKSLVFITRLLRGTVPLNFAKMFNIGFVLATTSSSIVVGIKKLSSGMPFVIPAISAARGLVPISKFLSQVVFVPLKNMQQLGTVLNNTSGAIVKGLVKFLGIRALVSPAITSANRLVQLSKIINQIQPIVAKNLNKLASVTSSTSWKLGKALFKFAGIRAVTTPAISAARGLVTLTQVINQIQTIFNKNLLQLSTVLGFRSIPLLKAIVKFSSITPFVAPAILTAKGLVSLTKNINQIQTIFFKNLLSLGTVLTATSGRLIKGLIKFSAVAFFTGPAIVSAIGVRKLSRILLGIVTLSPVPLITLASLLSATASTMISGLVRWSMMIPFIIPAIFSVLGVTRIFRSLASIANLKIEGILTQVPIINSLIGPIMRFSMIGIVAPQLIAAGFALMILGKSLKSATAGFTAFSTVPWPLFASALPTISGLTSTLISFGARGLTASTGIISMASSLNVLGRSLNNVSSSFGISTKSMADYNKEKDRLKTVAAAPKPGGNNELSLIQRAKAAAALGTEISTTRREGVGVGGRETTGAQVVQIKPIQIDLKLNGRQLQQIIVEANYNRT